MEEHPPLAYSALKRILGEDTRPTKQSWRAQLVIPILRNIIRSANSLGIATLAALERLVEDVAALDIVTYFKFLWLASLSIRPPNVVQEVLLVLHDSRGPPSENPSLHNYAHKHGLAVSFDRAEDAADACPCDEGGRPKRQRIAPTSAKLEPVLVPDEGGTQGDSVPSVHIKANVRVDTRTPIRIHSHVRLQVASPAEHSTLPPAVLDAVVSRASRGELYLTLQHPLPPEYASMDWRLYDAGSIATSRAMLDAVQRLAIEGPDCCRFSSIIVGEEVPATEDADVQDGSEEELIASLNPSQRHAVNCVGVGRMTLIWGPPGTRNVILSKT